MRMLKNNLNLEMTKGDTFSFAVLIKDLGQELESAFFTVKNNYDDSTPVFQKTIGKGIVLDHVDGEDYYYKVRIAPSDTENIEPKNYIYDFEIS